MDNTVPTFGGKVYQPGQGKPFVCDYSHQLECDGTCSPWSDDLLGQQIFPEERICFPSFDDVFGNCSIERTRYENRNVLLPDQAWKERGAKELKIRLEVLDKKEKKSI